MKLIHTWMMVAGLWPGWLAATEVSQEPPCHPERLCALQVVSDVDCTVDFLVPGVRRLSGGYRPTIQRVPESLQGMSFLRVPWRATPTYRIRVVQSGYLVALQAWDRVRVNSGLDWHPVPGSRLQGAHLSSQQYRVWVEKGQELTLTGYELTLVAAEIDPEPTTFPEDHREAARGSPSHWIDRP